MRRAVFERNTNETKVKLEISLDGTGESEISTGIGFLDHMLTLFSKHSGFDLKLQAAGDLGVEEHHLTEDIGICLGSALAKALGEKKGISRYGFFILPMDESLCTSAIDLGGRCSFSWNGEFKRDMLGTLATENIKHFWSSFAQNARLNLNVKFEGENDHHKCEAVFKSVARALKMACKIESGYEDVPSTKGVL